MRKLSIYFKYIWGNISTIVRFLSSDKYIFVDGFPHSKNFGDALAAPIVEFLSEKKVLPSKDISRFLFSLLKFKNYSVVGSILQWSKKESIVWGAGFISKEEIKTFYKPSNVCAVRGPKTRELFLSYKVDCPEIYGDPALLLPLMYNPTIAKKFQFGIIPHFYDFNHPWIKEVSAREDVLIIDLRVSTNYKKVIDELLSCEVIFSTSLHGVIISDAYKIKNRQITLSDKVVGAEFKFADYYESVSRKHVVPINPQVDNIFKMPVEDEQIRINLKNLVNSCPFITQNKKNDLLNKLKTNKEYSHFCEDKLSY